MPTLDDWVNETDESTEFDPSESHNGIVEHAKGSVAEIKALQAAGEVSVSFTNQTSFVVANVPLGKTFQAPPVVTVNIASASGTTTFWGARAYNVTTTDFYLYLFRQSGMPAQSWASIPVQWHATEIGS